MRCARSWHSTPARAEPQVARHVDAVHGIASRAVTRRLPGGGPITFGRGLEVTVELSEARFQDGSAFLLGSVLEVFFRRHVALNSFVETVVRTSERGEIMRWPAISAAGTSHERCAPAGSGRSRAAAGEAASASTSSRPCA